MLLCIFVYAENKLSKPTAYCVLRPMYKDGESYRCNRLRCPLTRLSGLRCFNIGYSGNGINLHGVVMIFMGNLHAGGQFNLGHLSLLHRL